MQVTDQFKENILKFGKQISVRMTFDNDLVFEKENIIYCSRSFEGSLFKTIIKFVDIELKGSVNVINRTFKLEFGVKAEEVDSYEYINWGEYIVDNESIEKKIETNSVTFTAYDYLKRATSLYTELKLKYPTTLKNFLIALCTKLGYTLMTEEFTNMDTVLYDDRFIGVLKYTNRDVLDHIAGAVGGGIVVEGNNLYIKYPTEINYTVKSNLKTLSMANKYGPLNSLTLSIQSDKYTVEDEESIKANGLFECEFINNAIVNSSRGDFTPSLFDRVKGLEFYQFNVESFGYAFFNPLDIINIENDGGLYKTIILSDTVTITTGINETMHTQVDNSLLVDYTKTNNVQDLINDTTQNLKDAVYYYTNDNTLRISSIDVELIRIRFTSKAKSTPLFNGSLIMKIDSPGLLEFTYILDNIEYYVHPKHTVQIGWFTLHLFLPLYELEGDKAHDLIVYVKSVEATGTVTRNQIQATINGQGLEVLDNKWDGTLQFITEIEPIEIRLRSLSHVNVGTFTTNVEIKDVYLNNINIAVDIPPITIRPIGNLITIGNIEATYGHTKLIVDEQIIYNYINKHLFISDERYLNYGDTNVKMHTEFVFDNDVEVPIDNGKVKELAVDLEQFKQVESVVLEVEQ